MSNSGQLVTALSEIVNAIDNPSWKVMLLQLFAGFVGSLSATGFAIWVSRRDHEIRQAELFNQNRLTLITEIRFIIEMISKTISHSPGMDYVFAKHFENRLSYCSSYINSISGMSSFQTVTRKKIDDFFLGFMTLVPIDDKNKLGLFFKKQDLSNLLNTGNEILNMIDEEM
jgi:hypothetical protein